MTPPGPWAPRLLRVLPAALCVAVPAILILTAARPGTFLFGYDVLNTFYALRGAEGRALAEGRLPLWDPHVTCGAPMLAQMQSALLYPPTWPAAILGPGAFWTFTVALHLSLAGLFAYAWLARGMGFGRWPALAGAATFMLSGYAISHVYGGHLTLVSAYPWAAAVLWRLERFLAAPSLKRTATLAGALTLMILAGFPQLVLIAGLAWAARLVHHVFTERDGRGDRARVAGRAVAALAAGVALAAPQLLPTLELIGQTQRSSTNDLRFITSFSLPPENLLTFVAPTFFGDSRAVPYWGRWYLWEVTGFVGVSALTLALVALGGRHRQRFLWGGLALAGVVLALGRHTPVFEMFALLPGVSLFRGPGRYLLLFTLSMAPLVALGFERLASGEAAGRSSRIGFAAAAGFLVTMGAGAALAAADSNGFWKDLLSDEAEAARGIREEAGLSGDAFQVASHGRAVASLGWAAATLAAIATVLMLHRRGVLDGRRSAAALGVLLGVELLAFDARYFVAQSDQDLRWPAEFVSRVRGDPKYPFRIATVFVGQTREIGKCQLAGLDHVGGYDPLMLRRYVELLNVSQGAPAGAVPTAMIPGRTGPVMDLLGVREWVIPGGPRRIPGWTERGKLGEASVYENPDALPRAFLVHQAKVLLSEAERLTYLTGPAFRPSKEVVLEEGAAGSSPVSGGTVQIVSAMPGNYRLRVDNPAPGWLVLTEAYYPGWRAEIDGRPAGILPADHLIQAIPIPAGPHEVSFRYRSTYLNLGLAIAVLVAALPMGLAAVRRRKKGGDPVPGATETDNS